MEYSEFPPEDEIVRNPKIPFMGKFPVTINSQHQVIIPQPLREIYKARQNQTHFEKCQIRISEPEGTNYTVTLRESLAGLPEEDYSKYRRINIGQDGRFVLRFGEEQDEGLTKVLFQCYRDYIEVTPFERGERKKES
jgi:hypothetical protein